MKSVLLFRIGLVSSILLSFVLDTSSWLGLILAQVPLLMALYACMQFSNSYQKKSIFTNQAISYLFAFAGSIVTMFLVKDLQKLLLTNFGNSNETNFEEFAVDFSQKISADPELLQEVLETITSNSNLMASGFLFIVLLLLANLFSFFSYKALANATGVKNFKTAGILLLVGIPTIIVFGLGFLLVFIGVIFAIVGAFQLNQSYVDEGKNHNQPLM
jgi:uncharacterized membrane protein